MNTYIRTFKTLTTAVLMCVAVPALAEAPVYDADALPQQQQQQQPQPPQPQFADPAQENIGQVATQEAPPTSPYDSQEQYQQVDNSTVALSLEQRMVKIEQQLNNLQGGGSGSSNAQVESLQGQVQSLRNDVEQYNRQLAHLQEQVKTMYTDLDSRLSKQIEAAAQPISPMQSTPPAPTIAANNKNPDKPIIPQAKPTEPVEDDFNNTANTKVATDNQPNVAEEQQIYQTAYNLIKAKKYNDAVTTLEGMLKKYPSGQFASNAHYWLGELYSLMGKNDQALKEFGAVVATFPDSPRVCDAMLKVGLIYTSESKWADAKKIFKKIITQYPGTASSRLSSEQLKQIRQLGH